MGRTVSISNIEKRLCLCHYRWWTYVDPGKTGKTCGRKGNVVGWVSFGAVIIMTKAAGQWTIQIRQNLWVPFANLTGQDSLCLSSATPRDPFRTCLIGKAVNDFRDLMEYVNVTGILRAWRYVIGVRQREYW